MTETDPLGPAYKGAPNESVTVTVEAQNTGNNVNFTLDGVTGTLTQGQPIRFNLKADGNATVLQFNFRFTNPTGGAYVVKVKSVTGAPQQESVHRFKQQGSVPVIIDYIFET